MKTICFVSGMCLGIASVYFFWLNGVEQFAWRIFWETLDSFFGIDGDLIIQSHIPLKDVIRSSTFWNVYNGHRLWWIFGVSCR